MGEARCFILHIMAMAGSKGRGLISSVSPVHQTLQLATAHAISETVTVLILQMRKQRLDNMPSVTQLVKQCLLSLLLDPGEGFHWPVLTHSPGS